LGFADSPELRRAAADAVSRGVPVGAGGSRLLRGNHAEHQLLEEATAVFFGAEAALYFGSGYAANQTLFAAAPQRGDLVIHDELVRRLPQSPSGATEPSSGCVDSESPFPMGRFRESESN
jgi:8-amino-7-oxononanoate synthase